MFGYRIGYSESADRIALFLHGYIKSKSNQMAAGRHLGKFRMAVSVQRVRDPIHLMFSSRVGFTARVGGSNGAISGCIKLAAGRHLGYFEWPYLRNGSFDPMCASRGHLCDSTAFLLE